MGRFVVYRGNDLIEDSAWKRRKVKSLFKLLLLAPKHQLLKDRLLEWLWPDHDPVRATNNLHRTLFILRRVLQPDLHNAADSYYITFKDDILTLNNEATEWVDIEEFERLIRLGRQQGDNLAHYEAARGLYQGDFLPEDLYEDWTYERRETLRTNYANLLQRIAQLYTQQAAFDDAISCLQALLGVESTHEEAYRELMRLYVQSGQRHQALHLYQQACDILQRELNIEPTAETTALYQTILEDHERLAYEPPRQLLLPKLPPLLETQQHQPLVGREPEIQKLENFRQRLEEGCGTVVILSGEQGVGKTRLAEEFAWRAHAAGMHVLYGAAHEQEGHLPYGPFVEAIRGAVDSQALALIGEKLGVLINDLARLLPELAAVVSQVSSPQLEPDLGQERQRLFDAVTTTLMILAQNSRVVVLLDDLHAAGESSLQLLHYLARRITKAPIFILCTVREERAQRGTPMARLCRDLFNHHLGQQLNLAPLDQINTAQLCSQLLDEGQVSPHLSETLFQLTKGNPFFIRELMLALKESNRLTRQNGSWDFSADKKLTVPASIREVIGQRLERLSHEAYRLAGLAAVIGQEFGYQLLQTAGQWDDTVLLDLLDEMLTVFLIEETDTGYRFYHGLIRQVLYDELTTHRRIWLHGQVAHAYENLPANQLDEQAAVLVHHYERAGRYQVAFRYLIRAGDWARATFASREALEFYNRALNLYRQHADLAAADTLAALLERRAQTYMALSDFDAAIDDLEKLLKNYQDVGDRSKEGEALYQLGIGHYWAHRLPKATLYLEQTTRLAQELNHHELYAKSLKLRDILLSTQGNLEQITTADVSANEAAGLPAEEHWGRAMLAHLHSDIETAIHHAQACVELGQTFANNFLTLGGYFVLGMSHASSGHYQLALEQLMHALDLSEMAEDRFWRARLLNTLGWVHRELFDLEQAIQFDEASLALARIGLPRLTEAEGNALANLATDYLLLKDYEQVQLYLAEGLDTSGNEPFMRWRYQTRMIVVKGRLALEQGNPGEALTAADEALTIARKTQARKNIARSCRLRGEALLAAGLVEKAQAALRHALSIGLTLQSPALIWPCYLTLAHLEEAAGNLEASQSHYAAAAGILEQVAQQLTYPALRQSFLTASPVKEILARR